MYSDSDSETRDEMYSDSETRYERYSDAETQEEGYSDAETQEEGYIDAETREEGHSDAETQIVQSAHTDVYSIQEQIQDIKERIDKMVDTYKSSSEDDDLSKLIHDITRSEQKKKEEYIQTRMREWRQRRYERYERMRTLFDKKVWILHQYEPWLNSKYTQSINKWELLFST